MNHQWFLFSKHKNTVIRSANAKKRTIKQARSTRIHIALNVFSFETLNAFISSINSKLKIDIDELYPNSKVLKKYDDDIVVNLQNLYLETDKKLFLVIDEWDYIITNKKFTDDECDDYIEFLKYLIKDNSFLAFAYMTGITAIAKKLSQSTLNCFREYTMLNDKKYYKYFGFTEKEVHKLCKINKNLTFENLKNWYNGYKSYNCKKILIHGQLFMH